MDRQGEKALPVCFLNESVLYLCTDFKHFDYKNFLETKPLQSAILNIDKLCQKFKT